MKKTFVLSSQLRQGARHQSDKDRSEHQGKEGMKLQFRYADYDPYHTDSKND
jgi:hypothetical protein